MPLKTEDLLQVDKYHNLKEIIKANFQKDLIWVEVV